MWQTGEIESRCARNPPLAVRDESASNPEQAMGLSPSVFAAHALSAARLRMDTMWHGLRVVPWLFAAFTFGCDCGGDTWFEIQTPDGRWRRALVHAPAAPTAGASHPVVLAFHGGGGDPASFRDSTTFSTWVEAHQVIVVFPEGVGPNRLGHHFGTWNAGACCGEAMEERVDDVTYISLLLDALATRYSVDTRRVYATGHSNGSMFTFRLVCELSDRLAAVAPYGGQMVFDDCTPQRNVPIAYWHGTEDGCVPLAGGTCGGCAQNAWNEILGSDLDPVFWPCDSVALSFAQWATRYGCSSAVEEEEKDGVTCIAYPDCPTPDLVSYCPLPSTGHGWPGQTPASCEDAPEGRACETMTRYLGPLNPNFDLEQRIWSFFSRHELAAP